MALRSTRCRRSRQKFSRDICRLVMAFAREVPPGHAALCGPRVAPLNLIPATPRLEWPALHHGPRCNYDSARRTDPNIPYTRLTRYLQLEQFVNDTTRSFVPSFR